MSTRTAAKKVLLYSHVAFWQIHHAETIELAWKHYGVGDEVYVLTCMGALASCPANPKHNLLICAGCSIQSLYSKHTNFPPGTKFESLKLNKTPHSIPQFETQEAFGAFSKHGVPFGQLVLSQLVDNVRDIVIPTQTLNQEGRRLLSESLSLFDSAREAIKRYGIDTVYVWNGRRGSDGPVFYAGKQLASKSFCYISGGKPGRYFATPEPLHDVRSWIEEIHSYGSTVLSGQENWKNANHRAKQYFREMETGTNETPGYAWYAKDFTKSDVNSEVIGTKDRLVIFTSSLWEMFATPSRKHVPEDFIDPYRLIERLCADTSLQERFEIIVRWHPNLQNAGVHESSRVEKIIRDSPSTIHFRPSNSTNSYDLMRSAKVVLTTGSTIGVEASFNGITSVLAGTSFYSSLGCAYEPSSYPELLDLLLSSPAPLPRVGAIIYGSWFLDFGEPFETLKYNGDEGRFEVFGRELLPGLTALKTITKKLKIVS